MVTDQQVDADIDEYNDKRDFWHQSGAMNPRGEFKQHLHLWTMGSPGPGPRSVIQHEPYPWVPIWDKLDVSEMAAYWHMTRFKLFPSEWDGLWNHIAQMRNSCVATHARGPYWMLLPQMSTAALAQQMTGMKRRIQNQLFLKNKTHSISAIDAELITALEPFLVMTPQQEIEDEAVRSYEIRRYALQNRDLVALGRPPRCR